MGVFNLHTWYRFAQLASVYIVHIQVCDKAVCVSNPETNGWVIFKEDLCINTSDAQLIPVCAQPQNAPWDLMQTTLEAVLKPDPNESSHIPVIRRFLAEIFSWQAVQCWFLTDARASFQFISKVQQCFFKIILIVIGHALVDVATKLPIISCS